MRRRNRLGPLLIALTLAPHAPAQTAAPAHTAAAAGVVFAHDFMFAPLTVTVAAGTTVTWTNRDAEPHTVVSDTGLFRSGALDTNESFSFRFDAPGTYHYACSIHPRMVGTIVVR
ncbi:MAG TPA: cupredoxin family copper-binding protein [Steroidobacteraceae bacterium]|nr:cupredoxin family copper-binding protein [Steroidobacteraceae bacterium]